MLKTYYRMKGQQEMMLIDADLLIGNQYRPIPSGTAAAVEELVEELLRREKQVADELEICGREKDDLAWKLEQFAAEVYGVIGDMELRFDSRDVRFYVERLKKALRDYADD